MNTTGKTYKKREKARRYAMQALYSWEISGDNIKNIEQYYLSDRNPNKFDVNYFIKLLHEVPGNLTIIDKTLEPFLEKDIKQIAVIELMVIRIAIYELKYCLDIPYKVIIDQALELSKMFGTQDGYKFVNGVLDKLSAEIRSNEKS